jgi:hypothetical protein
LAPVAVAQGALRVGPSRAGRARRKPQRRRSVRHRDIPVVRSRTRELSAHPVRIDCVSLRCAPARGATPPARSRRAPRAADAAGRIALDSRWIGGRGSTFEGRRWPYGQRRTCAAMLMRAVLWVPRSRPLAAGGGGAGVGRLGADEAVQELQGVEPRLPARCRAPWRQGQVLGPAGHELPGQ